MIRLMDQRSARCLRRLQDSDCLCAVRPMIIIYGLVMSTYEHNGRSSDRTPFFHIDSSSSSSSSNNNNSFRAIMIGPTESQGLGNGENSQEEGSERPSELRVRQCLYMRALTITSTISIPSPLTSVDQSTASLLNRISWTFGPLTLTLTRQHQTRDDS